MAAASLIALVAGLASVLSLVSIALTTYYFQSFEALPASSKLLFLACCVELCLLAVQALFAKDSQRSTHSSHSDDAWQHLPQRDQTGSSTGSKAVDSTPPKSDLSRSNSKQRRAAGSAWAPCLAALLTTAAGNILLKLLRQLQPYAWSQLFQMEVVVMGLAFGVGRIASSNSARGCSYQGGRGAYLVLLLAAVCVGQGLMGQAPASPVAVMGEEDERQLQFGRPAATVPAWSPTLVVMLAALAALCSSLASRIVQRCAQRQGSLPAQAQHCALVLACNLVLYMCTEPEPFEGPFDDMTTLHWYGVALLAIASLLSSQLSRWPAGVQLLCKGYAYECAVVITTACSGWLLPATHDVRQEAQFACSSFVAGAAILLLHNSMQHPSGSKAGGVPQGCKTGMAWLQQHVLKRLQACWGGETLLRVWTVTAVLWLLSTGWSKRAQTNVCNPPLSFTYAHSKPAMAELGITQDVLALQSVAPFPSSVLLATDGWAVWQAVNSASTAAGAPRPPPVPTFGASGASVPAWSLCPALTCSTDAACTAGNTTCCVHLLQHMTAFWDTFLHGLGLSQQYVVLHDTLKDAAFGVLRHSTEVVYMGISAAAVTVLERPCIKEALWRHGYVLFMQDSSWRLCANKEHPIDVFRQHMHPARHLSAARASNYVHLDVMWPHKPSTGPAPGAATPTLLSRMQGAVASSMSQQQQVPGALSWWLCATDEMLATARAYTVSMSGLHLPRPIDHVQHLMSSSKASSVQVTPFDRKAARCKRLVKEMLVHIQH